MHFWKFSPLPFVIFDGLWKQIFFGHYFQLSNKQTKKPNNNNPLLCCLNSNSTDFLSLSVSLKLYNVFHLWILVKSVYEKLVIPLQFVIIIDQCVLLLQTSMNVKIKLIHHALLLLYALTPKAATNVSTLIPTSWQKMEEHALVMVVNLLSIKTLSVPFYNTVKINQIAFYWRVVNICEKSLHNHEHKDTDRFCKWRWIINNIDT